MGKDFINIIYPVLKIVGDLNPLVKKAYLPKNIKTVKIQSWNITYVSGQIITTLKVSLTSTGIIP